MDAEEITRPSANFVNLVIDALRNLKFNIAILLFIGFLFICSTTFIARVLSLSNGAVVNGTPTTKGTILQGVFLVMFYIILTVADANTII